MKKILTITLFLFIAFSVFATTETTGIPLIDGGIETLADKGKDLMGAIDWFIAGAICLFVEFVVKKIFKDDKFKWVWKLSPVVISVIGYTIYYIVSKQTWYNGIIYGVEVGAVSMFYYDIICKAFKESATKGIKDAGEAVKEAVEKSDTAEISTDNH